jgi:hypothetical protein
MAVSDAKEGSEEHLVQSQAQSGYNNKGYVIFIRSQVLF